ncbi:porin [Rhizobium straminoryzae]|uniref:Porin n=1 Tax=Rhizobium straminoryzae TaxID=1387186 RepID=A0A549TAI4_9HYPH|nr:porin [Rhizobium straminoryzae]TRL38886.1 porin [Rhizobium straminoryzae]
MNIKSLLLGSAAALAAVSGAHAADAIVAAEPEPMEYVRVCDAFGAGYFYIPGSETCLKISGYVRFQVDVSELQNDSDNVSGTAGNWNAKTRGLVSFATKSDTELGALGSTITIRAWGDNSSGSSLELDEAFLTLGGFRAGYGYNYWDNGIVGETDSLGSNRINQIGYEATFGAIKAGLFVDELTNTTLNNNDTWGVEGQVSGAFGPVKAYLLGGYDVDKDEGAIRGILSAAVGPGTLEGAVVYSSGVNAYYKDAEWAFAAAYEAKINDKIKVTPGFQYWDKLGFVDGANGWKAGVAVDYAITKGFAAKVSAQYTDRDDKNNGDGYWAGYFRLQRSF